MAKRRRLEPARLSPEDVVAARDPESGPETGLETKSMFQTPPLDVLSASIPVGIVPRRSPIADVAADAAAAAALSDLSQTLLQARREGRLILRLPLAEVNEAYLVRDRIDIDTADMFALRDSLVARGQQTPIEVVDLATATGATPPGGRWGLISGWRRLSALRHLSDKGSLPDPVSGTVLAIVRPPQDAAAAYLAMVEENEIRVDLSYYERARIVARAVDLGVHPGDQIGLRALFASAGRSKRSKIGSFLRIVRALDDVLRYPAYLSERAGLALAGALEQDAGLADAIRQALAKDPPTSAEAEQALMLAAMNRGRISADPRNPKPDTTPDPAPDPAANAAVSASEPVRFGVPQTLRPGLIVLNGPDQIILHGPALTDPALRSRLMAFLRSL